MPFVPGHIPSSAAHFDTQVGAPDAHYRGAELTGTIAIEEAISYSLLTPSKKPRPRERHYRSEGEGLGPRVTLQIYLIGGLVTPWPAFVAN